MSVKVSSRFDRVYFEDKILMRCLYSAPPWITAAWISKDKELYDT
jgi:hypothetical protein